MDKDLKKRLDEEVSLETRIRVARNSAKQRGKREEVDAGPIVYTTDRVLRVRVRGGSKREDCDECYGTGFRSGFGMPCSKGCKA